MGREVLALCVDALTPHRSSQVTATARALGSRYGEEATRQGVSLPETVQAFTFFRSALLEALRPVLLRHCTSTHDLSRCWHQVSLVTDEVLVSMTQAYSRSPKPSLA